MQRREWGKYVCMHHIVFWAVTRLTYAEVFVLSDLNLYLSFPSSLPTLSSVGTYSLYAFILALNVIWKPRA